MLGLGFAPFGVGPYGLGTPGTAPVPGGKVHDDGSGFQTGSRMLSEETKQYVFDSYGRIMGMSDVRQLVLLAVSTLKGSAVMTDLGHDLSEIEDITSDFEQRVDSTLRNALSRVTSSGQAEILSITITRIQTPGTTQDKGALINLRWRDLTDPKKREHVERIE
jgi:hypothetical protein